MKQWREKEHSSHVYYDDKDGKIIGQVAKHGNYHTIYIARVYTITAEGVLGQYIDLDYGKKAVEEYWEIQERTLLGE